MNASPATFLRPLTPYRAAIVVAVACVCTWYGLADLGARDGRPFVLGQARSLKALHGGKATNDKLDAPTMAGLLRGGRLPQASVSPAQRRATRALLRRRMSLTRQRAALLAHIQQTQSPYHVPESGKKLVYQANRDGVAERLPASAVQKSMAVALTLLGA